MKWLTASRETTGMAGQTAVFMNYLTAAIRAGAHNPVIIFDFCLGIIADHPTDGIRTGKDLLAVSPGGRWTTDPGNLFKD
jgi:hypothetical protein